MTGEVDAWREDVLALLSSLVEPLSVLMLLGAFVLGLVAVRVIQ